MKYDQSIIKELKHRAARIRWLSLKSTSLAGSGHPTSCLSVADILSVLFFHVMRYDNCNPASDANDRLVLSKGHAAPALYAAWCEAGYLSEEQVYTLRKMNSPLEGHPMPYLPFVDVATGSLGQGLSVGLGIAIYQSKVLQNKTKTYVILGDGELAEGSVWEAFNLASYMNLNNLIAIVDVNRLGQSRETMFGHDIRAYAHRIESFGWEVLTCDGHNFDELLTTFDRATKVTSKPVCILAKTYKGYGVSFLCDKENWHGKPLKLGAELDSALQEVSKDFMTNPPLPKIQKPLNEITNPYKNVVKPLNLEPNYKLGANMATRQVVGDVLPAIAKSDPRIWVLDGDTQNSTYSQKFAEQFSERFIECFIAEQNMTGIAAGLSARGIIPFAITFGAFLSRAYDQIRMTGLSCLPVKYIGTHAGVSIGEDGPSQMALEDLAFFRTLPNAAVLYPSDAVSAYYCIINATYHNGPAYIRLSRPATPVIYNSNEKFEIGDCKIVYSGLNPKITLISAGVVLHEVLKAVKDPAIANLVQVVDLYSVKPFPTEKLVAIISNTGGKVAVFEEHSYAGGIGEAVASNLAGRIKEFIHKAVDKVPRSGSPEELLDSFDLSSEKIKKVVSKLVI